jgi:rhodanese-related sulfurtransferase
VKKLFKAVVALITALGLVLGVTACASEPLDMKKVTSVIDVRTADEYASGHLQGAINIDVEASDFMDKVMTLDTAGTYVVYCHSGRRAGIAVEQMTSMGFKNVTNAGGIDAASASTGLAIVQ